MTNDQRQGVIYGLLAYGLWGVVPLYFKLLSQVSTGEILMHRMLWCGLFLAIVVTIARRWGDVLRVFRTPRLLGLLCVSALLIGVNWLLYIVSVETQQVVQASMGYFLTPLLSVLLGLAVLGETMRPLQWIAVGVAALGCLILVLVSGQVPYLGLALAGSFALYGLARKTSKNVDGLLGLTIETLVLSPIAIVCLFLWQREGSLAFGNHGARLDWIIAASGLVTAFPLLAFGQAAQRLPLSSLGFLQFLSPTVQFAIAVLVFGEPFGPGRAISFAIIWIGVAIFLIDLWRAHWPAYEIPMEPE